MIRPVTFEMLFLALPLILLSLSATLFLVLGAIYRERGGMARTIHLSTLLILLLTLLFTLSLWNRADAPLLLFEGMLRFDRFSLVSQSLLIIAAILFFMIYSGSRERDRAGEGEFTAMVLFSLTGMLLLSSSANLLILFLGLELMSIPLYVLGGFLRNEEHSLEAGAKYFILSAFSSAFLAYGMALVYGSTGSIDIVSISTLIKASPHLRGEPLLLAGLALILVSFSFKVSLVPFHFWSPDVYEGAPNSVTAFMATGVKVAAFSIFLRLFATAFLQFKVEWETALWLLAAFTMTFGNILALIQTNIKRMLAYSSIAHAGYMTIGLISISPYKLSFNPYGGSLLYYLLVYIFMTGGAFGIAALLSREKGDFLDIYDYSGLATRRPWLSLAMSLFMVSLAGIPPTGGFFAKFYIFASAVREGYINLVVLAVVNCLISVYYYLRVLVLIYMHRPHRGIPLPEERGEIRMAIAVSAILVILFGLFPGLPIPLMEWAKEGFLSLSP